MSAVARSPSIRSSITPPPLFRLEDYTPLHFSPHSHTDNNRPPSIRSSITPPPEFHPPSYEHEQGQDLSNDSDIGFRIPDSPVTGVPTSPTDVSFGQRSENERFTLSPLLSPSRYDDPDAIIGHTREYPVHAKSPPIELSSDSNDEREGFSSASSSQSMAREDRKKYQILSRMVPRVLADRLVKGARKRNSTNNRRARPAASDQFRDSTSADRDAPLQPGQSRVRITHGLNREIRGDSESSDSSPDQQASRARSLSPLLSPSLSPSPSPTRVSSDSEAGPSARRRPPGDIISISSSDDNDNDDDDVEDIAHPWIDDDVVNEWVRGSTRTRARSPSDRSRPVFERDLIDRMLSRTRVPGGKRRSRKKPKARASKRRPRDGSSARHRPLRVVTSGAKESTTRQTRLAFRPASEHASEKRRSAQRSRSRSHVSRRANASSAATGSTHSRNVETATGTHRVQVEAAEDKHGRRKRKQDKQRHGVWTFGTNRAHVPSARREPMDADVEILTSAHATNSFRHDAAARQPRSSPRRRRLTHTTSTTLHDHWGDGGDDAPAFIPRRMHRSDRHSRQKHRLLLDCGVPLLPSGLAFDPTTYVGKGRLRDLVSQICGDGDVLYPASCELLGFHLNPTLTSDQLTKTLEDICDRLRGVITAGLEQKPDEIQQWQTLLCSVCQHVSWLCKNLDDPAFGLLSIVVEKHSNRLSTCVEESLRDAPDRKDLATLILEILWFLLELACRVECQQVQRHMQGEISLVRNHSKSLIRRLWNLGMSGPLSFFEKYNENPEAHVMTDRLTELWVSLIHVSCNWTHQQPVGSEKLSKAFWSFLQECIQSDSQLQQTSNGEASESIWKSIFALCALSQFSPHGLSTSVPRLAPGWHLVSYALGRIPLSVDPAAEKILTKSELRQRDGYIRLLISRCMLLKQRWRWGVVDASPMISAILEVFKSRRFANLLEEESDFPTFLLNNDLQLLSAFHESDTAFAMFLKLIVYAAMDVEDGNTARPGMVSPRVKKLLSLTVPVGSIPFTKATPPTVPELSMLYNRFSAVAIAIYLDPTEANLKYRMDHARRYVNFANTDHDTRQACIRGLKHFAIMLRHLQLSLTHVLGWLAEMTNVLVDERTSLRSEPDSRAADWIVVGIQMLLRCVRYIIETPVMDSEQTRPRYPDPLLIEGRQ